MSDPVSCRQPPSVAEYELLRCIGRGGYGDVWLARNVLGQLRAVKFVYRNRFSDPRPFKREFAGIQRFEPISRTHPSQLAILHVGNNEAEDCFYYVMELADRAVVGPDPGKSNSESRPRSRGSDLDVETYEPHTLRDDLQKHGRLPISDCIQIGLSLTTALTHLHEKGLVHRDIKPSNVIFVNGVAKLGDIGLVTDAGDTQSIVGTEGYLPPEGPGTPQADIYSLGKVLYEISTAMDRRQLPQLPADLREWLEVGLVLEVNEIVLRACASRLSERYASAEAMRVDLERILNGISVRRRRRVDQGLQAAWKASVIILFLGALVLATILLVRDLPEADSTGDGPPSPNQAANALCGKALMNLRGDNQHGIPEVYTNFHQAIDLDPKFAKPYVGLLELHLREGMPGLKFPPSENLRTISHRLTELRPSSAAAYCGQAILSFYDRDYPGAERQVRHAISLSSRYELAHSWYGFMLAHWGRPEEGRRELEIALGLNGSKVQTHRLLGHTYYAQRDFVRAIEFYRRAIGWESHDLPSYEWMGDAYRALGDYRKALDIFEEMEKVRGGGTRPEGWAERLRRAFELRGAPGYWEEELNQTPTNQYYLRAYAQAYGGHTNEAFQLLEESFQTHEREGPLQDYMEFLLFDEVWDKLRDDPRFIELLDKIGYTKVMPKSP